MKIEELTNTVNNKIYSVYAESELSAEFTNKLFIILDNLEKLSQTDSDLRFCEFKKITDSYILVEYYGHEVGGSYVHDYEVAPGYEAKLSIETNRVVKWTKGRRCGGFGSDIYEFKVDLNSIKNVDIEDRIITGKLLHIDGRYAFRYSCGLRWAYMYGIAKKFQDDGSVKGLLKDEDNIVWFTDAENNQVKVFKIHDEPFEEDASTENSGRTHFKGTFELFVTEAKLSNIFLEIYAKNNRCTARIVRDESHGLKLEKTFRDGTVKLSQIGYL